MSYNKRYYGRYRSASRSHKRWVKLCAKKVRRLQEPKVIEQGCVDFEQEPGDLAYDERAVLAARQGQRQSVRQHQQKIKKLRHSSDNYMTQGFVDDLIEAIGKRRWCFHYSRGDYARQLLSYVVQNTQSLRGLKQSQFRKLLNKPAMKRWTSQCGDGRLALDRLYDQGHRSQACYLLTLGQWGKCGTRDVWWQQTSRPGKNLVLQLNFSGRHNRVYDRLIDPEHVEPFQSEGHPIASNPSNTMAWVRIDVAEDLSHALIEEIQTDWLRLARLPNTWRMRADYSSGRRQMVKEHCNGTGVSDEAWQAYEAVRATHKRLWAEASLSAAIKLLYEEMGIPRIFYHSFASGCVLKGMGSYSAPPQSLYKRLPEQFCFTRTQTCPPILETCVQALKKISKRRRSPLEFYELDLRVRESLKCEV